MKMIAYDSCPDTDPHIEEMKTEEKNPSDEQKRFGFGTFWILLMFGIYPERSTPIRSNQIQVNNKTIDYIKISFNSLP
jgi:hypothetical protein